MAQRTYLQLPINADEGFPQAFRLDLNGKTYQILLYINIGEDSAAQPDANDVYTLPDPRGGAFMVMRVVQEDVVANKIIFQRKLVPDLEYEAAEVAFLFKVMQVARLNINGIGAFGSQVIGGIAARWDS